MPCRTNTNLTGKTAILFFSLCLAFQLPASAQEDCSATLLEAREYYEQGLIEKIPDLLAPCLEEGFTRAQKIEAYKLLILAHLFNYDQLEAESTMEEFLKKYPEYEIMPDDPAEFIYLFESYRTTQVFSIGISAGFNFTNPRIIESFTAMDLTNTDMANSMKGGFQIGLGAGQYISRNMLVNMELYFAQNRYTFSDKLLIPLNDGTEVINEVDYVEKLFKIEIPVSIVWEFNIGNMTYYLRTGLAAARITGASGQPSRKYAQDLPPLTGEYASVRDFRKKMLYSAIAGAGIRYKIPRGVISFDLRMNLGLNNIVRSEMRYKNPALETHYYVDDDFTVNTISLSAGYYFSFYTPSKER